MTAQSTLLTPEAVRVVKSMWHRTRKEFVPWSGEEIARRAQVTPVHYQRAFDRGLIRRVSMPNRAAPAGYEITELGRKIAEANI